ncbi:MAG TPA: HD domain-containing protein [Pseudomonas xinjiangensis]|uniref:HD domain-containing protein n=2 Tax=root TaxID=1 RepID=A0A7V1BM31_9GAMM|nr:HD domain-containing protein [Halopseudomonas xinjiangensis]HEC47784.1 HD domain-containing protein [Halopseudomonas xinjiangensis]
MDLSPFIQREIDKLKGVVRKSPLTDQSRRENSAEHSWHLAMYALILSDHADRDIDINRVIRMLLIHDIVEIDAGDHPLHEAVDLDAQEKLEIAAASRIFGLLPKAQAENLRSLWVEFEEGKSGDAVFAKALDRLQPLIQNIATDGGTWNEANVTHQQVQEKYGSVIRKGAVSLWKYAANLVSGHFEKK